MEAGELSFAAVILAGRAVGADGERIAAMVQTARENGAEHVVVAVPRGWRAPVRTRVAHVPPGAPPISAVRAGMAQLSNTGVRFALLWPLDGPALDHARLLALLEDVKRERATLTMLDGDELDRAPVMVARDAWLELMTVGEQGIGAVVERRGLRRVAVERAT
jgi:molybdopterin-guanine dinucleotide biosynthesis protein A